MGKLQKEALAAYDKIKAERGEVTFIDAFVAGHEQAIEELRTEIEKLKSQLIRGACASQIAMETSCKEEAYNEVLNLLKEICKQMNLKI